MKKYYLVFIVIIMLAMLIVGCGGGGSGSTTPTDAEGQINELLNRYAAAMKSGDADGVLGCITDPINYEDVDYNHSTYKTLLILGFTMSPFSEYQLNDRIITIIDSTNATVTLKESFTQNVLGTPTSKTTPYKFTLVKPSDWKITKIETVP